MLIFLVGVLMSGVVYSAANGVWPSFYGEMFSTNVRLSGMAIGTQIGFAIGGFSPSIAAAIQGEGSDRVGSGRGPRRSRLPAVRHFSGHCKGQLQGAPERPGSQGRGPTGGVNVGSSTGPGRVSSSTMPVGAAPRAELLTAPSKGDARLSGR